MIRRLFFANATLGGSCAIQDKQTPTLAAGKGVPRNEERVLGVPGSFAADAFFFEAKGTKKKALQKRNAVLSGLCAPNPQEHFEKSSTKNLKQLHQKLKIFSHPVSSGIGKDKRGE
ncbi:MAG: hypothetical protein J6S44_02315 [Clostridia bacterium]|nr:hypothetical protein [Clostridia bacterium]